MTKDEVLAKLAAKEIDVSTASRLLAQLEESAETNSKTKDDFLSENELGSTVDVPPTKSQREVGVNDGRQGSASSAKDSGCLVVVLVAVALLWGLYTLATAPPSKSDPYSENPLSDPDLYPDGPWP